jgi:AcrR family transcriptional regulator
VDKKQRRTRKEGMQLLLEATQKLLITAPPDDIGIRDIGEAAGVHHRFVAEWFGGKVGLFRAVHDARTQRISELLSTTTSLGDRGGSTLESIRHEIVLVNWLIQHDSKFGGIRDAYPALIAARDFLMRTLNVSVETADKSAQIFGAIIIADAMLAPHIKREYSAIELIAHHIESLNAKTSSQKAE